MLRSGDVNIAGLFSQVFWAIAIGAVAMAGRLFYELVFAYQQRFLYGKFIIAAALFILCP